MTPKIDLRSRMKRRSNPCVKVPQPKREKPNIVFLFSDTGGGHRSAAKAIIEALELEFPGQTTQEMIDIFREYAPEPINHAPEIYPPLVKVPQVFGMGFHISNGARRARLAYSFLWPYIRNGLNRLVCEHPADLFVSVHQLINAPVTRALAAIPPEDRPPFATVVTDLVTTHAAWYSERANKIIVPTDAAFKRGMKYGISSERMKIIGQPVADRFCQPPGDKPELRARLGWPDGRPVVLLVGGGEGMGPLEATARAINAANLPLTLVVVAGRNQRLKERLEQTVWNMPTIVTGFVQEMPDFMRATDILITKAGPGTICEAFIAGLPVILYSRLLGQEEGNVDYVTQNGAGVWAPQPEQVVSTLRRWLSHPQERRRAAEASLKLARPHASRQIAQTLMELMKISTGSQDRIHTS